MRYSKKVLKVFSGIFVLTSISLLFYYIFPVVFAAWVGPTEAPPGGNIDMVDTCSGIFGDWCGELDYSGQADVIYDDYRKNADSEYTRPLLSTWTQTSSDPEIWKDERTGLYWSAQQGSTTTNYFTIATCDFYSMARGAYTGGDTDCGNAINRCADLNGTTHGGRTGWYLPSQHELMQAYLNGMYIQTSHSFTTTAYFLSSSEVSYDGSFAWRVFLVTGSVGSLYKGDDGAVRCVSRAEYITNYYYFDVSISGPTDPGGAWSDQAYAFDGIESNQAVNYTDGSKGSNYLEGKGTNASGSGVIHMVRARIMSAGNHGNYVVLDVPSGGWTWDKLSKLETRLWAVGQPLAPTVYAGIYVEGDAGGTELGTPQRAGGVLSIIQLEVTSIE